ncbi:MAG: HEAT repeat domain-containing protein, partial [Saprospiraceae bacterium]|nr:HEAT repeat domain-containing protein [Saprospiraceae bacterium]
MGILTGCASNEPAVVPARFSDIAMVGGNLCSRMMLFGHFETELQLRYPDSTLIIRNMCDPGDTPGFRPHPSRPHPWAFPGAERFQNELAQPSHSEGHFDPPDDWLRQLDADIVLAFFGYDASFRGHAGMDDFRDELTAFIRHTRSQAYNGVAPPELVLISPIAFEDLSAMADLPDGYQENARLSMYTGVMREVAEAEQVHFVDAFAATRAWYTRSTGMTIDGFQLSDQGYRKFSKWLADEIFGPGKAVNNHREAVHRAVMDKNWFWHNDFKIPNGVHVYGRRYEPFGPDNYPAEIGKIRAMTRIRDTAIWAAAQGIPYDVPAADRRTPSLPEVETNFNPPADQPPPRYLYGDEAVGSIEVADGYHIELFASEQDFPDLANPVQLSFDNRGRLWVAVMPSYPHYRPGDALPDDKLLILEDTDGDGKADKQTVFADGLHLPIGFEFAPAGVYVAQSPHLKLLTDTDGDDRADQEEVVLSGFDEHDTHHAISAFCADPSGAIYMAEGVFLHTNVETAYGTVRGTNGGFYRYNPQRRHLERTAQLSIPNPWGIAFDAWGQNFFAETSGPDVLWMMPGTIKPRYGIASPKSRNLIEEAHRVRPTSGLEFVSSRHFPPEVQGDLLINNTIGFRGTKQHTLRDSGTGYFSEHRLDLIRSSDPNFRPVDMEFAPDGSLYIVDWHNILIGHMQHNARDPLRDHVHGRIYRITYPARPLVESAEIDGASIQTLLDHLKLPEYRTRYRARRELRERDPESVSRQLSLWVDQMDTTDPHHERLMTEGLWVSWGMNRVDPSLLRNVLRANDFRARAAAVRVLRYAGHQLPDQAELLQQAAADPHGRVRLEVIVTASWLDSDTGLALLAEVARHPLDDWMLPAFQAATA